MTLFLIQLGMFCQLYWQQNQAAKRGVANRPFIENGYQIYLFHRQTFGNQALPAECKSSSHGGKR